MEHLGKCKFLSAKPLSENTKSQVCNTLSGVMYLLTRNKTQYIKRMLNVYVEANMCEVL